MDLRTCCARGINDVDRISRFYRDAVCFQSSDCSTSTKTLPISVPTQLINIVPPKLITLPNQCFLWFMFCKPKCFSNKWFISQRWLATVNSTGGGKNSNRSGGINTLGKGSCRETTEYHCVNCANSRYSKSTNKSSWDHRHYKVSL